MTREATTNLLYLFLVLYWPTSSMLYAADPCVVYPTDVVVVAGGRVSLNCAAKPGSSVSSWQMGGGFQEKIMIYKATAYKRDGTTRSPRFVADGYSVDDASKDNQAILHINSTSLSQAGNYYCICSDRDLSAASSAVVVIEPKFSTNFTACGDERVTMTCSISSSESVSRVLTIKDAFGSTVARLNDSSPCSDVWPASCKLNYTIAANTSANQSFSCSVNVTTNKNLRVSEVLNSSVDYSSECSAGSDSQRSIADGGNDSDAIVAAVCCVIIVAIVASTILLVLYRKRICHMIKRSRR